MVPSRVTSTSPDTIRMNRSPTSPSRITICRSRARRVRDARRSARSRAEEAARRAGSGARTSPAPGPAPVRRGRWTRAGSTVRGSPPARGPRSRPGRRERRTRRSRRMRRAIRSRGRTARRPSRTPNTRASISSGEIRCRSVHPRASPRDAAAGARPPRTSASRATAVHRTCCPMTAISGIAEHDTCRRRCAARGRADRRPIERDRQRGADQRAEPARGAQESRPAVPLAQHRDRDGDERARRARPTGRCRPTARA